MPQAASGETPEICVLKGTQMSVLVIGVDVSQETLDMAVAAPGKAPRFIDTYSNDAAGFAQLAAAARQESERCHASEVHLVMEPTGGYEQPMARYALEQGWRVSLPNPRQVRDWAKGDGRRAKTDRQDALLLAAYGVAKNPPQWLPLPEAAGELEALLERRDDLNKMLQQELNRQHALQARGIKKGAVTDSVERSIARLQESLAEIEAAIDEHIDQNPDLKQQAKRLRTVPGIGAKNVLPILVLMQRWDTLTGGKGESKGLVAYVGLDPVPYSSGRTVRKRSLISRAGDPNMRRRLFMGAFGGIRGQNPLRAFYQGMVARGKAKRLALVAAARKILTWAWAVFRSATNFDQERAKAKSPAPA